MHGFLSILAIFRALYELSIAYNIILYNILDVFQESLNTVQRRLDDILGQQGTKILLDAFEHAIETEYRALKSDIRHARAKR